MCVCVLTMYICIALFTANKAVGCEIILLVYLFIFALVFQWGDAESDPETRKKNKRKKEKECLEEWLGWLRQETARTFTPGV